MPKSTDLSQQLSSLARVRDQPHSSEAHGLLEKALQSSNQLLVAAAADIVGTAELTALLPMLPFAFDRFMKDPDRTDKNCKAKTAIANALQRNNYDAPELYRRGVRYVQREPAWGGSVDTAAELRGICAMGLAGIDHPDAVLEIAGLLNDPERAARANAARAAGYSRRAEAIPLLRFKALIGDPEPQVITECLSGLLDLDPERSLPFVAKFLASRDDAVAESAALALGQSHREEAFPLLREWEEMRPTAARRVPLLAIAMLRLPAAFDYLVSLVEKAPDAVAALAISALALHKYDESLRKRVEDAVHHRKNRQLDQAFNESF